MVTLIDFATGPDGPRERRPWQGGYAMAFLAALHLPACHARREPAPMPSSSITDAGPGASLASSIRSVPPRPAPGCPALRADAWRDPGTVHAPTIEGNETWTAEGSPHRLPDGIHVASGASVTLVPCALVLAPAGRAFIVDDGGALFSMGEATRPVTFDADGAQVTPGAWDGISFACGARITSRLVHTRVRHAGARGAALESAMRELDVAHVSIDESEHAGVALRGEAAFASGAVDLVVHATHAGPPLIVEDVDALGSIPHGRYTGNSRDAIDVAPASATASVHTSQTWSDLAVPYAFAANVSMRVDGATLTIAPHVSIEFGANGELRIGETAAAALRIDAIGAPVQMRAEHDSWRGITLGARTDTAVTRVHGLVIDGANGVVTHDALCANAVIHRALFEIAIVPDRDLFADLHVDHIANDTALVARQWIGESRSLFDSPARLTMTNAAAFCVQTAIRERNGACPLRPQCEGIATN